MRPDPGGDPFEMLLLDVLRDVQVARRLNSNSAECRAAWVRAADSLKFLLLYCQQRGTDQA